MTNSSKHRDIDKQIEADMDALRAASHAGVKSLDEIGRGVSRTSNQSLKSGEQTLMNPNKKRWIRISAVVAVLAITGVVYATTSGYLFSVSVDTEGMTEQEVEDEVHDQLVDEGVDNPDVKFKRNNNKMKLDVRGEKNGKQFRLIKKQVTEGDGDAPTVVTMQPPALDTEREPGMTDAQLEAKIQAQVDALGMDGTVKVNGDKIRISVEKEVEECEDGPCPDDD